MDEVINFILLLLAQFAGGPGPIENNLVRFGLPSILWGILLYIAWNRQRTHDHPREKILVWGFALAFIREMYMFGQMAYRIIDNRVETTCNVIQPLEHGLSMSAMILVSGAFIHTLSDKARAKRYLQFGFGITILVIAITSYLWPQYIIRNPGIKFHQTYLAWLFHLPLSLFMGAAIILLWRTNGWLRNVVASAFTCYLVSEIMLLVNYATDRMYNTVICPLSNSLHILAAPLLGYVYLKELALEKKRAEEALLKYRDHLKDLVEERTAELTALNSKLVQEVADRSSAEKALERISNRYAMILESAGEGICELDNQGRFVFATPAAAKMLGYQPEELINRPCLELWHPKIASELPHSQGDCPIYQGYDLGQQRSGDDEHFWHRNGSVLPVHYFSYPVYENGNTTGTVIVFRDITERKRSENEIAQRNRSLATQNAVSEILSQSLHIETNLQKVLEILLPVVDMDVGLIFLADTDPSNLNLYVSSEILSREDIQIFNSKDCACNKISQQAYLNKQLVSAIRTQVGESSTELCAKKAFLNRLISVPLTSKGLTVGVMTLGRSDELELHQHQFELLTSIGLQIGMAIENARLFTESETHAEDISRLHEASSHLSVSIEINHLTDEIAMQSAWLLNCSKSYLVNITNGVESLIVSGSYGLGLNEIQCIQQQLPKWTLFKSLLEKPEIAVFSDASIDGVLPLRLKEMMNIRSFIILPIWSTEKPHSFIFVLDDQVSHQWQKREVELIERFSNRAAMALMNATLHQQRELAAALEERHRIAANMHDGLAQTLSLLNMKVDRLKEIVNPTSGEIATVMDEVHGVVAEALVEVRHSIASLQNSHTPPANLQELLQDLVVSIKNPQGPVMHTDFDVPEPVFLTEDEISQVIPLAQEAILNAMRHANPGIIKVRLEQAGLQVRIIIEDDGCGFEPDKIDPTGNHFGVSIMRARAERLHGRLTIKSSNGNGTQIALSWIPKQHAGK